jgi:hypothetical protein
MYSPNVITVNLIKEDEMCGPRSIQGDKKYVQNTKGYRLKHFILYIYYSTRRIRCMNSASFLIFYKFTWWWSNIRAETCREYRSYIIKYLVNCCETEGIIIYSYCSEDLFKTRVDACRSVLISSTHTVQMCYLWDFTGYPVRRNVHLMRHNCTIATLITLTYQTTQTSTMLPCILLIIHHVEECKSKAIPVTGCGGLQHCLDSRLTDGGKVVSPTHRPHSTPQKHYFSASGTHFC